MSSKTFGRRGPGFSLRNHLVRQNVTTKEGLTFHFGFVLKTLQANPSLDITRYRVDENNPNGAVNNG